MFLESLRCEIVVWAYSSFEKITVSCVDNGRKKISHDLNVISQILETHLYKEYLKINSNGHSNSFSYNVLQVLESLAHTVYFVVNYKDISDMTLSFK
jgi:hypothetical protein